MGGNISVLLAVYITAHSRIKPIKTSMNKSELSYPIYTHTCTASSSSYVPNTEQFPQNIPKESSVSVFHQRVLIIGGENRWNVPPNNDRQKSDAQNRNQKEGEHLESYVVVSEQNRWKPNVFLRSRLIAVWDYESCKPCSIWKRNRLWVSPYIDRSWEKKHNTASIWRTRKHTTCRSMAVHKFGEFTHQVCGQASQPNVFVTFTNKCACRTNFEEHQLLSVLDTTRQHGAFMLDVEVKHGFLRGLIKVFGGSDQNNTTYHYSQTMRGLRAYSPGSWYNTSQRSSKYANHTELGSLECGSTGYRYIDSVETSATWSPFSDWSYCSTRL